MDIDKEIISDSNINYYLGSKKGKEKSKYSKVIKCRVKCFKIIFYIAIITTIIFIIKHTITNNQKQQLSQTNKMILWLYNKISVNNQYKIFTQIINQKQKEELNFFCDNLNFLSNNEFENQIRKVNVDFNKKIYDMFIFIDSDAVSNSIAKSKNWESYSTLKILEALNFYTNKTHLKNEDLYILDIGANIGWYSFYLGKYGYNIMSFEPTERNFYILKKNYCLNRDINITIINKGLYTSEEVCDYYEHIGNKGNGMVICHQRNDIPIYLKKTKTQIILTKLSNFIPFLSEKNVTFIKIDIEGAEEAAILSGIELISKYHVPFILMEYYPNHLRMHDVNNTKFLQIFENNGYKISKSSFLDKNFVSIKDLEKVENYINLYIIYTKILIQ
jgi:FkbM family methyltransferase